MSNQWRRHHKWSPIRHHHVLGHAMAGYSLYIITNDSFSKHAAQAYAKLLLILCAKHSTIFREYCWNRPLQPQPAGHVRTMENAWIIGGNIYNAC